MPTSRKKTGLVAALIGGASTLASTGLIGAPIETPAWDLEASHDGWEIRRYEPRLEARVTVTGDDFKEAVNRGFRVLAGFIFGENAGAESVEMTAPVSASRSAKIAMTAPVGASAETGGGWTVSFTMPSTFTASTLPRPTDPRIQIVEVPGGSWAVAPFRGRAVKRRQAVTESLESALAERGLEAHGAPEIAQYNPPWIPGPMRRNEILIRLASLQ